LISPAKLEFTLPSGLLIDVLILNPEFAVSKLPIDLIENLSKETETTGGGVGIGAGTGELVLLLLEHPAINDVIKSADKILFINTPIHY
jgi:hypothetical protein